MINIDLEREAIEARIEADKVRIATEHASMMMSHAMQIYAGHIGPLMFACAFSGCFGTNRLKVK